MRWIIEENAAKTGYNLILDTRLEEELEARKLVEVVRFLTDHFQLDPELNMLEYGMPPYYRFKEKNNISITVAVDEFDGLSVDSNNREFLEKLAPLLEQGIFFNEFNSR